MVFWCFKPRGRYGKHSKNSKDHILFILTIKTTSFPLTFHLTDIIPLPKLNKSVVIHKDYFLNPKTISQTVSLPRDPKMFLLLSNWSLIETGLTFWFWLIYLVCLLFTTSWGGVIEGVWGEADIDEEFKNQNSTPEEDMGLVKAQVLHNKDVRLYKGMSWDNPTFWFWPIG